MRSTIILAAAAAITGVIAQNNTGLPEPNLPVITAADNTLNLGDKCSTKAQCKNGADCYGTTKYTILTCGSFNGACSSDSQCASNTCQRGICSGYLEPSASRSLSPSASSSSYLPSSTGGVVNAASVPAANSSSSGNGTATSASAPAAYTGGATSGKVIAGFAGAAAAAAFAFVL